MTLQWDSGPLLVPGSLSTRVGTRRSLGLWEGSRVPAAHGAVRRSSPSFRSWSSLETRWEKSGGRSLKGPWWGEAFGTPCQRWPRESCGRPLATQPSAASGRPVQNGHLLSAGALIWGRVTAQPPRSCCPERKPVLFPLSCSPSFYFPRLLFPVSFSLAGSAAP